MENDCVMKLQRGLLFAWFGHAFSEFHDKSYYFISGLLLSDWLMMFAHAQGGCF